MDSGQLERRRESRYVFLNALACPRRSVSGSIEIEVEGIAMSATGGHRVGATQKPEMTISDEHEELIAMIELIKNAVGNNSVNTSCLANSLQSLLETTKKHFKHEEDIMAEKGYHGLALHKNDHDYLLRGLEEFLARLVDKSMTAPPDLANGLKSWLTFHIKKYDNTYLQFMDDETSDLR